MATPIKIPFYTAAIIGTALGGSIFWAANQVFNESTDSDASTDSDDGAQAEEWGVPSEITDKIPSSWQNKPNKKKVGIRWQDPENQGNGIRIDQGDKNNSLPSQQVDHAIVRKNGQVIGRDGKPIQGSIKNNGEQAHIPLSEYQNWKNWDSP